MTASLRAHAESILRAGIAGADARAAVSRALELRGDVLAVGADEVALRPGGRVVLAGAGKAAAGMALGALDVLGERIDAGTVTVPDGYLRPLPDRVEAWEAAHPVPDARGLAGASAALRLVQRLGEDDVLLCLLSGGASALWPAPPEGVSLTDVAAVTRALMRAGAPIAELNAVRKHLSRMAGGGLARAAFPARALTLAVSDVVGSPLDVIASGPTVADRTTFADALAVLAEREVDAPASVLGCLRAGAQGRAPETAKEGDAELARSTAHVVARTRDALDAAAREAERLGYRATVLSDDVEGEARDVAGQVAALAWGAHAEGGSAALPAAFLLGGETTVTVRGAGRGGRCQELALAAAIEMEDEPGVVVAAAGTDGRDGPTGAAGAVVDGRTVARGRERGMDARAHLERNDANPFLAATGDLLVTGPTGTNVADLVLVLVGAPTP